MGQKKRLNTDLTDLTSRCIHDLKEKQNENFYRLFFRERQTCVAGGISPVIIGGNASQVAYPSGAYPGFRSMKQLGVFLLPPGWDVSPSQGYPQH